jgi:uncharacterized protein YodC (DUF2158 family)
MSVVKLVPPPKKDEPRLKFTTGNQVRLKGDSQKMVVKWADKDGVTCSWTSDLGEPQEQHYLDEMLELVPVKRARKEIVFTPSFRRKR